MRVPNCTLCPLPHLPENEVSKQETIQNASDLSEADFEALICEGIRKQIQQQTPQQLMQSLHLSQSQALALRRVLRRYQRFASA